MAHDPAVGQGASAVSDSPPPNERSTLRLQGHRSAIDPTWAHLSPPPSAAASPPQAYRLLDKVFALTLVTAASCSVFLTVVYWVKIYPEEDHRTSKVDLDNLLRHGINIAVTLGDVVLSRTPVCGYWFHAVYAYGTVYVVFFAVYTSVAGNPYPSLSGGGGGAWRFYTVVALSAFLCAGFLVTYLVALLRECISGRQRGKVDSRLAQEPVDIELACPPEPIRVVHFVDNSALAGSCGHNSQDGFARKLPDLTAVDVDSPSVDSRPGYTLI